MYVGGTQCGTHPHSILRRTNPIQNTHDATRRREQGGGGGGGEGEEGEGGPDQNDYYVGGNSARGGGRCVAMGFEEEEEEEEGVGVDWGSSLERLFETLTWPRPFLSPGHHTYIYTRDTRAAGSRWWGPPRAAAGTTWWRASSSGRGAKEIICMK